MSEHPMHDVERQTIESDPTIGGTDVSQCLPGWIKTFCDMHLKDEGTILGPTYTRNLLHTLIAAKVRAERLVRERDMAIDELNRLVNKIDEVNAAIARNRQCSRDATKRPIPKTFQDWLDERGLTATEIIPVSMLRESKVEQP